MKCIRTPTQKENERKENNDVHEKYVYSMKRSYTYLNIT